ncbi:MAG: hypothetical protein K2W82_07155 [Candidatus Obscuribacterales bacterium]|nr:hypothetical protein [Candidatus Obscuribacterales bacterium]
MKRKLHLLISCSLLLTQTGAVCAQGISVESVDDSLLPPEVVPLDPSYANAMSLNQAQNRQAGLTGADTSAGFSMNNAAPSQQMRNMPAQQFYPTANNQMANQMGNGQMARSPMAMGNQMPMNNQMVSHNQMPIMANNQAQSGRVAQTLASAPKAQPKQKNTHRGFSNALNYATAFGAGAIMSGFLIRPNSPWLGAGMYGLRYGSRF